MNSVSDRFRLWRERARVVYISHGSDVLKSNCVRLGDLCLIQKRAVFWFQTKRGVYDQVMNRSAAGL